MVYLMMLKVGDCGLQAARCLPELKDLPVCQSFMLVLHSVICGFSCCFYCMLLTLLLQIINCILMYSMFSTVSFPGRQYCSVVTSLGISSYPLASVGDAPGFKSTSIWDDQGNHSARPCKGYRVRKSQESWRSGLSFTLHFHPENRHSLTVWNQMSEIFS